MKIYHVVILICELSVCTTGLYLVPSSYTASFFLLLPVHSLRPKVNTNTNINLLEFLKNSTMPVGLKRDRDVIHKTEVQMNNWAKQKERERLYLFIYFNDLFVVKTSWPTEIRGLGLQYKLTPLKKILKLVKTESGEFQIIQKRLYFTNIIPHQMWLLFY